MDRPTWPLLALLLVLAFAFQGTRGIWEPDEGRYTATGINMYEHGDWLVPSIDGEHPHLTKPPVTYWALATSFAVFGRNEWAARLPGALAFVGTGLLVFGLGRRLCAARPWLPATIYALSLAPVIGANIVSTDGLLTFFETAAMFAFVEAWHRGDGLRRGWIRMMWILWGLAFMTKGPPGLLPLLAVVLLVAWRERPSLRSLFDPLGIMAFAVVAFTWFAVLIAQEPGRLGYFLGYEVYDRVFTAKHDRNAQWYGGLLVYVPVLLVGPLPWWALAVTSVGGPRSAWSRLRARLREGDRQWWLLVAWFTVPFVVFMLARSRLQLYILPLFVPLALMAARPLANWRWLTPKRLAWTASATAIALLAIKGVLAYWHSDRDAREMARAVGQIIDPHGIDEIAFVGMRPFYGLNLYLDIHVESVDWGEKKIEYSRYVSEDDLCSEIRSNERNVYALKQSRSAKFLAAAEACAPDRIEEIGRFEADGNQIAVYKVILEPGPQAGPD
jgi:4-amino-4-deoxy-L-arabinose transferase-like glycosyltransferase